MRKLLHCVFLGAFTVLISTSLFAKDSLKQTTSIEKPVNQAEGLFERIHEVHIRYLKQGSLSQSISG